MAFLRNWVQRRLRTLLLPFSRDEPDLQVELGFTDTLITLRNFRFDVSQLNQLLDGSNFQFEKFTVDHLVVRLSVWSAPAIKIEIRGVNVKLSARGTEEGSSRRKRASSDTVGNEIKKVLLSIDPEGCVLHDILEKMLGRSSSQISKLKTSFSNLILRHFRIRIHGINVQVCLPGSSDLSCVMEINELRSDSENFGNLSLVRSSAAAVLFPLRRSSLTLSCFGFNIGYKRDNEIADLCGFDSLVILITLHNLQLVDLIVRISELSFSFRPTDLPVLMGLANLSSKDSNYVRNGRYLWKVAARRTGLMISPHTVSFQNLVSAVVLWLRYVNAYEYLLSLAGYSRSMPEKSLLWKFSENKRHFGTARRKWEMICNIEKELPAEAIARARRVARYRTCLQCQNADDSYDESSVYGHFNCLSKTTGVLAYIWRLISRTFWSIACFLWSNKHLTQKLQTDRNNDDDSERVSLEFHAVVNLGKLSITFYPEKMISNLLTSKDSTGHMDSNIVILRLSVDEFLVMYTVSCLSQCLSASCGKLKVESSSFKNTSRFMKSTKDPSSSSEGNKKHMREDVKTILDMDPAQRISKTVNNHGSDQHEGMLHLQTLLREMWLNWNSNCMKLDKGTFTISDNPCLLVDVKSCMAYEDVGNQDSEFWKCSMVLGKLDIVLEYSSLFSLALLIWQTEWAQKLYVDEYTGGVHSSSFVTVGVDPEIASYDEYGIYRRSIELSLHRVHPERQIQVGILLGGPQIKLLVEKAEEVDTFIGKKDLLLFDFHEFEFVIWPTSKSDVVPSRMLQGPDNRRRDRPLLQELGLSDTVIPSYEKYVSQGWNSLSSHLGFSGFDCSFCKMAEKNWSQVFVVRPVTICFSSLRENVYSFSEAIMSFSIGLDVLVLGLTIVSKPDDLNAYFQMLLSLVSGLSRGLSGLSSAGHSSGQEFLRSDAVNVEHEIERTFCKTLFVVKASIKLKDIDVIFDVPAVDDKFERLVELDDSKIWSSVQEACIELSCEENKCLINVDLCKLQSILFKFEGNIWKSSRNFITESLLFRSHDILFEACLSSCLLSVSMDCPSPSALGDACCMTGDFTGKEHNVQVHREVNTLDSASDSLPSNSTRWIHINLALTDLFVARGSTKNVLVEVRRSSNFVTSVSIGRKFQSISCSVEGGLFVLEPKTLIVLIHGYSTYLYFISSKVSVIQNSAPVLEKFEADSGVSEISIPSQQENWYPVEAFSIDVTQFALGFVCDDEYGGIREIVLEITLHSSLDSAGGEQKFLCEVSRLSVLCKILESVERDINITQFSSPAFSESSSFLSGTPLETSFQQSDVISSGDNTSASGDFNSLREFSANSNLQEDFHSRYKNYILEDLRVSASVKKRENTGHQFSQAWVGGCSVLGFDITISLSELQMVLSMLSLFAALPGGESTHASLERPSSFKSESERSFESVVPDGAIVAIQDINQHMFFTVEDGGDKCVVTGTLHYSLVGERALFRVSYHRHQGWNSSTLWFSLTSLYAKNNKGEPLRLNYHSSSDIVNVSGLYDNAPTLFRASFGESENYKGDIDWETYRKLVKDTFYLVNKKSDSAVAFIDGFPEFVRKPGNPFKFKVFRESLVTRNLTPVVPSEIHESETQSVMVDSSPPSITVTIDGVSLTIVHELSETRDRFPLFRGSVNITELAVQMLSSKVRIMSISNILVLYFDAQTNQWREFIHPVEVSAFYRSTFQTPDLNNTMQKVPTHIYCRIGKLDVFLTELSMDMLLFVLGKLEFAGPFSVKTSAILSNCCKIENLSGLDLICRFNEKQTATVGRKQTASIFLRHSMNHQPEASPVAAVQLSSGKFITSSINVSLLEARTLAWRTRIISLQDARSHPGPFVVVDIKKGLEDGLSISVSPLTRIHNETSLPMEIRFQRSKQKRDDFACVPLKPGGSIDDSVAAFNAISLSGDMKKALTSLAVGNFSLSFRPESFETLFEGEKSLASEWSEELEGGKAVRLTGIFDKLSYGVKRALSIESVKVSLTTTYCSVISESQCVGKVHFLIHSIRREVSIIRPDASSDVLEKQKACIALREQKEIFLLPTVQVSNFLSSEAAISLTETDQYTSMERHSIGKHATLQSGKTIDFYVNPDMIYFRVTLTTSQASCKPVNSGQWVKKLQKQKNDARCLDVDLDFSGGKYCASLRLSLGKRGILEAAIFTSYILKNDSDCTLFFFPPDQKPLSREDMEKVDHNVPPEFGLYLPPKTEGSWFLRSRKVCVILADGHGATEAVLDLDALSGLTEISLGTTDESGFRYVTRFGLSVRSISSKLLVPSRIVTFVPRHLVINESEETINIRQRYFQDDSVGIITIKSKQRAALRLQEETTQKKELHLFENFIKKHGSDNANPLIFIQFRLNKANWSWSGPLCITSIGCFFLKFRKQSGEAGRGAIEFASVNVTEEGSTLAVHFQKPPNTPPPYRIENFLHAASLTYYQKDSSEIEVLGPGSGADYAWDDMTLPHKLVVIVDGMIPLREVSLDKVRPWKPLFKATQHRNIASHLMLKKKAKDHKTADKELSSIPMVKVGYEVYADGLIRVIRICEVSESLKGDSVFQSRSKIQFRVTHLGIHLLEKVKQNAEEKTVMSYSPILVARLDNVGLHSMFTDQQKFNQLCIEALNVDHKWAGAPFAAMLRQHQSSSSDANDCLFKCVFVLVSSGSSVTQVKHSSIVLQPVNLNLDEETLMRVVAFWRSSLSTNTQSSQYYFDHFEIHPIKITANFVPGSSYSSYNSAQETLRSLLHSVVKVPHIKNMVVELNGVLVTHALITIRELLLRCVKHYSWYAMRAIYIAKGSPLLPPAFASMFDDFSSSSLDAFFDPSRGLVNVPGLTVGTFKLLSKLIDNKGLSGTRRYFGDLGKTLRTAGSNVVFVALTEISDSVLRGAEMKGVDGLVSGFHHGILKLAMEPSVIGTALMEGGPDRTIKLDRNPGIDELYIEGYLQAMLDTMYRQEYLRVKVIDDQVNNIFLT
ncbi:Vacuolar protein sorting-associated protein 13 C-terminal [Arabidopsis suecica]|uniref:Vacuolar protein sorting-associated protein 13 C-terminal n=1 Tax=Arabidopsis suecica TaxID=45249 RepID=A0A8T1ZY28_ARASU|nr:Vacuolar protein sorting-associated protein 13 C-terminal [Arabidopsis suecica]